MLVEVQLVVVAGVPLNVTVPEDPKLVPVIVTAVPTIPDVGFRLVNARRRYRNGVSGAAHGAVGQRNFGAYGLQSLRHADRNCSPVGQRCAD